MSRSENSRVVSPTLKSLNRLRETKAIKIHGDEYMESGTPDIIGSDPEGMFAFEAKDAGNDPSPIQQERLIEWGLTGARVGVIYNESDALALLYRDHVLLSPRAQYWHEEIQRRIEERRWLGDLVTGGNTTRDAGTTASGR